MKSIVVTHISRLVGALVIAALLVSVAPAMPAASRSPVKVVGRAVATSITRERTVELPIAASHVALHWPGAAERTLTVAFSADGVSFTDALPVDHDEAGGPAQADETWGGVIWTGGARFVRVTTDRPLARLTVVAIDSGPTPVPAAETYVASAAVSQPPVVSRAGWGADESLRFGSSGNEIWPPEFQTTQKLVVHHTAGRNDDPDPASTVRAIYYYHAVTRGWGDIGYNLLVDEAGRIYEGRYSRPYAAGETPTGEDTGGRGVTAAHVGGWNSGTVGIALLGTLTDVDAEPAARSSLEWMLAWKAERHGLDPRATDLYTNPVSGAQKVVAEISGHRDWAATECPGGVFYSTLPALREAVAARMSSTTPKSVPGAPTLSAADAIGAAGIQLTWSVPADGGSPITGYRIFRRQGKSFSLLVTVGGSMTAYRDGSAKRGRTYTYIVRAVNAIGIGPASNQASASAR
jgi:hypothetical protein